MMFLNVTLSEKSHKGKMPKDVDESGKWKAEEEEEIFDNDNDENDDEF